MAEEQRDLISSDGSSGVLPVGNNERCHYRDVGGGVGRTLCGCGMEELCCVGLRVGAVWLWGRKGRSVAVGWLGHGVAVGWAGSCHGYGVYGGSLSMAVGQICSCRG